MKIIKLIISVLIFCWCSGYFVFIYYSETKKQENLSYSDAIIVLGTDRASVYTGIELINKGYAEKALVVGYNQGVDYNLILDERGVTSDQILFNIINAPGGANAAQRAAHFIKQNEFLSVRIVSYSYHIQRAVAEMKSYLPRDVIFIKHKIFKKESDYNQLFFEYNKFILTFIASLVGMADEINLPYS